MILQAAVRVRERELVERRTALQLVEAVEHARHPVELVEDVGAGLRLADNEMAADVLHRLRRGDPRKRPMVVAKRGPARSVDRLRPQADRDQDGLHPPLLQVSWPAPDADAGSSDHHRIHQLRLLDGAGAALALAARRTAAVEAVDAAERAARDHVRSPGVLADRARRLERGVAGGLRHLPGPAMPGRERLVLTQVGLEDRDQARLLLQVGQRQMPDERQYVSLHDRGVAGAGHQVEVVDRVRQVDVVGVLLEAQLSLL